MKFSVITPTFNRSNKLRRAVDSVCSQDHQEWEMIIVNDSPENVEYGLLEEEFGRENRIVYLRNEHNLGSNASRNRALRAISDDSDRVIFLDDDDYLSPGALTSLAKLVQDDAQRQWLVTNRTDNTGRIKTSAPKDRTFYSYAWDYLIRRRVKGDATHCLDSELARMCRFPTSIKNGEEWLYFFQIGRRSSIFYSDTDTTLTDGYDPTGLNFRYRSQIEQLRMLRMILLESRRAGLLYFPYIWIYLLMRLARLLIK